LEREPLKLLAPTPLTPPAHFIEGLASLGVTLDRAQTALMGDFLARLLAMNEQMNLTAITSPDEAWTRHALDALSLVPELAFVRSGGKLIDVGSGGGVPGIPLAIARPDLEISLVEATQKKAAFLIAVSAALGLGNVRVYAERAEELVTSQLAGTFDAVTARALAKMQALLPWTGPFARRGGKLLFIKGQRADEEMRDAKKAIRRFRCVHERTVQTSTGRVVVFRID
jgi:16S rRNA (guanine527-N7)-methyltransferase